MASQIELGTAISLAINIVSLIFAGTQVLFSWQCMIALKSVYDADLQHTELGNGIREEGYRLPICRSRTL
jgi:hypothetical protein